MASERSRSEFRTAARNTRGLENAWREGLRAIRRKDRKHVKVDATTRLAGSIEVDGALQGAHPNANRWDYAIGVLGRDEFVVWLEIHPASSSHVEEILKKSAWLLGWLKSEAPELDRLPRRLAWVASGRIGLATTSPQSRRLAQAGIGFPRRVLNLNEFKSGHAELESGNTS